MFFSVLGAFEVLDPGGDGVEVSGGKQLATLAVLLVFANQWVSADHLIAQLWEGDPPRSAAGNLSTYLWGLRRALPDARVERGRGRYRLIVERDEFDLFVFQDHVAEARKLTAAGLKEAAVARYEQGLALWRGAPFDGLRSAAVERAITPWIEQRLAVEDELIDLQLDLGRHAELIVPIRRLLTTHPTYERRWEQLMLALDGVGRRAEALDAFQEVYQLLATELGVAPGHRLQAIQQRILSTPEPAEAKGPAQLPAAVSAFTGRRDALKQLDNLVSPDGAAVIISTITGTAGVGKTALAVHWAQSVAEQFPAGQLYLNLQGYSTGHPVEPNQALEWLLHGLGVPGEQIPRDLEARMGLYRTTLAGRRLLVLLDNAASVSQVRPLLPGAPGCLALITSRDSLAGLTALDGAKPIRLGVLTPTEADDLLSRLLGPERIDAEPQAAQRLADLCARLPLALRLAAANLGEHSITQYVELLAADQLDLLKVDGDPDAVVQRQLDYSYQQLAEPAQRLFRLLGLSPTPDFTPYSAAALAELPLAQATRLLNHLAAKHLVEEHQPGRYAFHDLLRAYARQRTTQDEAEPALRRLYGWYLTATGKAMDQLDPNRVQLPQPPPAPTTAVPEPATYEEALDWLEAERMGLLALTNEAARSERHQYVWQFPQTLWRYFYIRGYHQDWINSLEAGLIASEHLGDNWAKGEVLHYLSSAWRRVGNHELTLQYAVQALEIRRSAGDESGEAATLGSLGNAHLMLGNYAEARAEYEQALTILRRVAPKTHQAFALVNLAMIDELTGQYREAVGRSTAALALFRESGNRMGEAHALANIAHAHARLKEYDAALEHHQVARDLYKELGNRWNYANAISSIGDTLLQLGRITASLEHQQQALELSEELGDAELESIIHNSFGHHYLAVQDYAAAEAEYENALALATTTGSSREQSFAHHGLARTHQAAGNPDAAEPHWQQALALYTAQGRPEADDLRRELAVLRGPGGTSGAEGVEAGAVEGCPGS